MHYITNAKNQIIAADEEFLNLLSIDELTDIYQYIANNELSLEFGKDDTLNIKTSIIQEEYSINKTQLHSLVGEMYLIELKEVKSLDIEVSKDVEAKENVEAKSKVLDDVTALIDDVEGISISEETDTNIDTIEKLIQEDITKEDKFDSIEISDSDNIIALVDNTKNDSIEIEDLIIEQLEDKNESKELEESTTEQKDSDSLEISDDELFDLLSSDDKDDLMSDIKDDIILDEDENEQLFELLPKEDEVAIEKTIKENDTPIEIQKDKPNEAEIKAEIQELLKKSLVKEDSGVEPIVLDAKKLSSTIGISEDDYKSFVDEYITTAIAMEKDITSSKSDTRKNAITTLSHLSNVLYIPVVGDVLNKLENADGEEFKSLLKELYNTIARLSIDGKLKTDLVQPVLSDLEHLENIDVETPKLEVEEPISTIDTIEEPKLEIEEPQEELKVEVEESKLEIVEEQKEEPKQEVLDEVLAPGEHKIDLSDVKPIHFDFSMDEAADELSLPVDLIEEFVGDFIEQAHEETERMLTAYDNGDLDKVNKLGHLLKGTSSNLRIVPLADTLYKIQFCENLDELEPLIKDYWGHFLAFEKQIKLRLNK